MMNKNRRRKTVVSSRNFKKHSGIVGKATPSLVVPGERIRTATGYRVSGFSNRTFETFHEVMLSGTATDVVTHAKKDKSFWVLSGDGFVTMQGEDKEQVTRRLLPGDSVAMPRGTVYRITTTSNTSLALLVTQSYKYDKDLKVVEEVGSIREATDVELAAPSMAERTGGDVQATVRRIRGSKAAVQQAMLRGVRTSPQVENPDGFSIVTKSEDPRRLAFASAGTNAKPTGGNFDDAGAG